MQHPLLRRIPFLVYTGAITFCAILQVFFSIKLKNLTLHWAIVDASIFHSLYFVLGLSIWYFVSHTWTLRLNFWRLLSIQLAAVTSMSLLWLGSGYGIMSIIYSDVPFYLAYLDNSLLIRLISGDFYFILIILSYFLFLSMEDRKMSIESEQKLRDSLREAELELLKSQINPHFLFNSLNSVSLLTLTDSEKAHKMIVELSEYLRYSISGKHNTLTPLRSELDNALRYLEIERIRFGNRLQLDMQCHEPCMNVKVPTMLLQPLFENAIKHGVYESTGQVQIRTTITMQGEFLEIFIANNFEKSSGTKKGAGLGLRNVRDRIRMVYGTERAHFSVEKKDQIYTAHITIPQEIL